ncbi:hypothetical protein [Oceanicella sp. SM1341]|uniref:hypothetical protein n=1 Tax=Oceanicella sp. SM1341 TaxID=1548889 RepID=UPI000E47C0C3|nr:hypothetical protein [Oceanicella sp. SM1341]
MSLARRWPLQVAVVDRLRAALAGQGPGGADLDIYTAPPAERPAVHLRVDGWAVLPRRRAGPGATADSVQSFMVHVFASAVPGTTPAAEATRIQGLALAALEDWQPIPGATGVDHVSSSDAPDQNPATHHAVSRFRIHAGG